MSKLYDNQTSEEWMDELNKLDSWNRKHALSLFSYFGVPRNMLDIGSGTGIIVTTARMLGVEAYGVDQLVDNDERWPDHFFHHNLMNPFSLGEKKGPSVCDMVICLEVAEHIPSDHHEIFCDTIASHLKRDNGSILIFSSAHPGQGGIQHESERPAKFWRDKFHERGLTYRHEDSTELALLWSHIKSPLFWLPSNVQVFDR